MALTRIRVELREARVNAGLSLSIVAAAVGRSCAEISRIERGRSPNVPFVTLVQIAAVVGLDLVARLYPGPAALRDSAQTELLGDFRSMLHPILGWATEVPLPIPGDQRAWDGTVRGPDWLFGVEVETAPRDGQAVVRRLRLKIRDGGVDGALLLLRDTRTTRGFLAETQEILQSELPVRTRPVLARLRAGERPDGNAIVVVPRQRRVSVARP